MTSIAATAPIHARAYGSLQRNRRWALILSYVFLVMFAIFFLTPPYYMIVTALKSNEEVAHMAHNPWFIYDGVTFSHFWELMTKSDFPIYFRNTVIVTLCTVAITMVVSVLAARVPTAPIAQDPVRYIPCPKCAKLMNRVNFAKSSGVIVDVCKSDGVWLDRGELQRVVGFIDGGGLEVAREHERERLVEEQRRLAALEQHASAPAFATQGTIAWSSSSSTSNPAIEQLLRDALGIFLK